MKDIVAEQVKLLWFSVILKLRGCDRHCPDRIFPVIAKRKSFIGSLRYDRGTLRIFTNILKYLLIIISKKRKKCEIRGCSNHSGKSTLFTCVFFLSLVYPLM